MPPEQTTVPNVSTALGTPNRWLMKSVSCRCRSSRAPAAELHVAEPAAGKTAVSAHVEPQDFAILA